MSADMMVIIYWWLFTIAVVGGAIGCVTFRSLYHAALSLITSLAGVAGYFVLLHAEFLAMAQIIVYVGGIMVLIIAAGIPCPDTSATRKPTLLSSIT